MKLSLYVVLLSLLTFGCAKDEDTLSGTPLRVSTYNLKWFGLGTGSEDQPLKDFRSKNLKTFIDQQLGDSDIIMFTEVVKTNQISALMADTMNCVSYEGAGRSHQHVALCFNKTKYRVEAYDEDFIIPEVNIRRFLRPALQAKLCHIDGDCFVQLIGLHLKAGKRTEDRIKQMTKLSENLATLPNKLPSIILGDLNSYRKERNEMEKDDIHFFEEILAPSGFKFRSITHGIPTYGSGEFGRDYDHIMVTANITSSQIESYPSCSLNPNSQKNYIPYASYRKYFSDHCPISASLEIKGALPAQ